MMWELFSSEVKSKVKTWNCSPWPQGRDVCSKENNNIHKDLEEEEKILPVLSVH